LDNAPYDLGDRMHGGQTGNTFFQVDYDQGRDGTKLFTAVFLGRGCRAPRLAEIACKTSSLLDSP
jgi:hypothetical protein